VASNSELKTFSDNFPIPAGSKLFLFIQLPDTGCYVVSSSSSVLLNEHEFKGRTTASSYCRILRRLVPHHMRAAGN
jgi:hypothetical protein